MAGRTIWFLLTVALVAINSFELRLLWKMEREFSNNDGHSLRDLADRMEALLLTSEAGAAVVAQDLLATQGRADAVDGPPGEASDAASRSPTEDRPMAPFSEQK